MTTGFIYDSESFPNFFALGMCQADGTYWQFEVSPRVNQSADIIHMLQIVNRNGDEMIGFNNEFYDWPLIQGLWDTFSTSGTFTAQDAYTRSQAIIGSQDRFKYNLWPNKRYCRQTDLFKVHHFDNFARATSLKKLEINMRADNVIDLPYPFDQPLTGEQMDHVLFYMQNDIRETAHFAEHSEGLLAFRRELAAQYPDMGDVMNMNDTKIGKKYFEMRLQQQGVQTHTRDPQTRRRTPVQTNRPHVDLADVISPRVVFNDPEFNRILDWMRGQRLERKDLDHAKTEGRASEIETKGVLAGVHATVGSLTYHFGTGGIHGSVERRVVREDDQYQLWDWDVASYYPNLAISNRFFPHHLGEGFCDIYENVYQMRKQYPKGSAENAMLKLALNGVYGDSNNKYSIFYDPQYTMSITINGQLMLCMLAEWLQSWGTEIVQINTDGLTLLVHNDLVDWMKGVCAHWEAHTGLELESAQYTSMFIRDVNSYIAVKKDGKRKRIGAYAYVTPLEDAYTRERGWHKDHSALVVPKAAEAAMVDGVAPADFMAKHDDPFDFMCMIKVNRDARLELGGEPLQKTSRYYVSTQGEHLVKIMPPLAGKTDERRNAVQKGWRIRECNNTQSFNWGDLNRLFYTMETDKLVIS